MHHNEAGRQVEMTPSCVLRRQGRPPVTLGRAPGRARQYTSRVFLIGIFGYYWVVIYAVRRPLSVSLAKCGDKPTPDAKKVGGRAFVESESDLTALLVGPQGEFERWADRPLPSLPPPAREAPVAYFSASEEKIPQNLSHLGNPTDGLLGCKK